MSSRLELLKENRKLLIDTLEHVKNVTNIGMAVAHEKNSISISLPDESRGISGMGNGDNINKSAAQLKFTQNPDDGIKVRHIKIRSDKSNALEIDEVENISPKELTRELILERVIDFLEEVHQQHLGKNV